MQRYHVDALQARRVATMAETLARGFRWDSEDAAEQNVRCLGWAAKLHEIGISVAYSGYHRHSAYILENADMPGYSRDEQQSLAALVLAHRRSLKKIQGQIVERVDWRTVLALRLAVLLYRHRTAIDLPRPVLKTENRRFRLALDRAWLQRNPLTVASLREEAREWERIGYELRVPGLEDAVAAPSAAASY
jgi:exopolyphosphatase/guanosine-5'-triphosphate,3'-diphosphate pyrophosphatase